ncbi:MAG: iron export ABC transporter permease subunit FetB [Actinomycetota bacterium]
MAEGDVGWLGLAASLLLIAVTLGLSLWRRLGLERDIVEATVRALVQLLAVGYVLTVVIDPDQPLVLAAAWVTAMVLFAAWTVARRAPEIPGAFRLALPALATSTIVTLLTIFGLGIFPLEARTLVPLGGMMIGNAMKDTVVAGRRIIGELSDKRPEVEARLALGQTWRDASRPHVRAALRTAMISQIETTKAVGLVFLPGTMTGLVLAGVDPVDAVLVQAAIMFLILGAVVINVVVIGESLTRRLFTAEHQLIPLPRVAT